MRESAGDSPARGAVGCSRAQPRRGRNLCTSTLCPTEMGLLPTHELHAASATPCPRPTVPHPRCGLQAAWRGAPSTGERHRPATAGAGGPLQSQPLSGLGVPFVGEVWLCSASSRGVWISMYSTSSFPVHASSDGCTLRNSDQALGTLWESFLRHQWGRPLCLAPALLMASQPPVCLCPVLTPGRSCFSLGSEHPLDSAPGPCRSSPHSGSLTGALTPTPSLLFLRCSPHRASGSPRWQLLPPTSPGS